MLQIGTTAPNFKLQNQNSQATTLTQFLGKVVVLYFYPKDDTPGCTKEACGIRDSYKDFINSGIVVLGVSNDTPKSHEQFIKKYQLPFTLLSDTTQEVIKTYGAFSFPMNKRITYIIDKKGIILKIYTNIEALGHAKEILSDITKLIID